MLELSFLHLLSEIYFRGYNLQFNSEVINSHFYDNDASDQNVHSLILQIALETHLAHICLINDSHNCEMRLVHG